MEKSFGGDAVCRHQLACLCSKPGSRNLETSQAGLAPHVSVFLSDVETDTWSASDVLRVARRCERLVITQGSKGAEELNRTGAHKVSREMDGYG